MENLITDISTFMHVVAGVVFFIFAFFEIFAALKPGNKIPAIGSFLLFCSGISGLINMLSKSGGTPDSLLQMMSSRSIFMLFFGLYMLISTSGLIGIMQYLSKNIPNFWKFFQMLLFAVIALTFYQYPRFYSNEEFALAMQIHRVICYAIAAGAAITVINIVLKNKPIAIIAVMCFLIAGSLLIQYKEDPKAFVSASSEFTVTSDGAENTENPNSSAETQPNN